MMESATFPPSLDSLPEIFDFTARAVGGQHQSGPLRASVDFVLEELFTNIVKYGAGQAPVCIEIVAIDGGVEVTVIESDAECFDVTQRPPVDTSLPAELRVPGGLGLHLIPKMVDCMEYRYSKADRCSRITFRKTRTAPPSPETTADGEAG